MRPKDNLNSNNPAEEDDTLRNLRSCQPTSIDRKPTKLAETPLHIAWVFVGVGLLWLAMVG